MSQHDYRRQACRQAIQLARALGHEVRGNRVRSTGDDFGATLRLHDALANTGAPIQYAGNGDVLTIG